MGFLSKLARKGIKKRVAQMPRRRGGFLRGMPMMKPSIGDMRFRGRMPRRGGMGGLGEAIRRLKEQRDMGMPRMPSVDDGRMYAGGSPGLYKPGGRFYNPGARLKMPQPIPRAEIDISALERLAMGDMPMAQDLPEVAPIGIMPKRIRGMKDMEPRMMMQAGEDVSLERELFSLQAQLENLQKQLEMDRSYNDDQAVINTSAEMAAIQKRIQEILQESGRTISDMDRQQMGRTMSDIDRGRTISDMDRQIGFKAAGSIGLDDQGNPVFPGYAEGDEVIMEENEIDAMLGGMDSEESGAMEDLEQMAPEMEMIDQLVTMVVQMIQQGASEEEVIMFLREQGLDDEDIGTVLQLVAEMAEAEAMPQDGIGAELEQLA
jgi:hypothetical protein